MVFFAAASMLFFLIVIDILLLFRLPRCDVYAACYAMAGCCQVVCWRVCCGCACAAAAAAISFSEDASALLYFSPDYSSTRRR